MQDIVSLRKLAAIRGLVTHGLRSRVWPLLLGTHNQITDEKDYTARQQLHHKDAHVVAVDMDRSLWGWTEGWSNARRSAKRAELRRILDATINGNEGDMHYYQGLHDVAAVLLFVCGEGAAFKMLSRLASCHLRDCTRPTLQAAIEALGLLYPILKAADPELYSFITNLHEPSLEVPYFALSWHMTWFSHDVPSLDQCARLFDLFISSHPLMPLYVAAVAVRSQRATILGCGPDHGDIVYSKLKGLQILGPGLLSADELAQQAAALYRATPPAHVVASLGSGVKHSTALFAYIEGGRWHVPDTPGRRVRGVRGGVAGGPGRALMASTPAAALVNYFSAITSRSNGSGIRGDSSSSHTNHSSHARHRRRAGPLLPKPSTSTTRCSQPRSNSTINNDTRIINAATLPQLQGVAALTAVVFTGIAGAAFLGTTLVLSQTLNVMGP